MFVTENTEWQLKGACRDEDPELFFPVGKMGPALEQIEEAKDICRVCPVREECLDWATRTGQKFGVWGGTTEDERRTLRKRMKVSA